MSSDQRRRILEQTNLARNGPSMATLQRLFAAAAIGAIAGCGGGGDDPPAPPPPAVPLVVSGVVADGPLQGATACYDLNDNAACDAGEPNAVSDADGRYSFEVTAAAAGQHAVIVDVPATAVDKDTGAAVGTAFRLTAPTTGTPGTQTVFVSPLTTLVVNLAAARGVTPAVAATQVQQQLGLANSPLANFVSAGDAQAATHARTVNSVITEVAKLSAAANVAPDAAKALTASMTTGDLALLAELVKASTESTPGAIAAEVAAKLLAERNLTAGTIADIAEAAKLVASTPVSNAAPGPFFSMRRFTWTDAQNHQLQAFVGDSSVTDANGRFAASEARVNRSGGVNLPFNRNTAYWVNNAWAVCPTAFNLLSVKPATTTEPQESIFCGASTSHTRIGEYDVSGQKMADVVAKVRASSLRDAPGFDTDATGHPTRWGPDPALLGDAVFPPNSVMTIREQINEVGGTERYSLTDKPRVVPASGSGTFRHAATFTDLKHMSGNWVNTNATVSNLNTIFLDDLPFTQTNTIYSNIKRYRAAFDPANDAVRYFACDVLVSNGTSLNCAALGDGTTSITAQADSRVLRFTAGYPIALTLAHKRQRLFVERDGAVFGGNHDLERKLFQQRPNTTAWNALRTALGMAEPAAPTAPVSDPTAGSLLRLTFTDAGNFSYRTLRGGTPVEADGTQPLLEQWEIFSGGVRQPWVRNVLYWTGTEWYACPDDPNGNPITVGTFNDTAWTSEYCKAYKDSDRSRTTVTLDGRNVADVIRDIRWYSTKDGTYDYANFGPNPDTTAALANAVFPPGSTMHYAASKRDATPFILSTAPSSRVRTAPAADTTAPFDTWPLAASLADVIAKYPGDWYPITVFNGQLTGNITLNVFSYDLPTPPAPEYTTRIEIRVAFDAVGQKARFYRNNRAVGTNFTTNYVKLLDTTYTIEQAGDAKVMRFAALPAEVSDGLAGERLFIERGALVSYGTKESLAARRYSVRINFTAAEFLGNLLGLP